MKWFQNRREQEASGEEMWCLSRAVEQAKRAWQAAGMRLDLSGSREVEDAIYELQLAEKRYMFLLNQARAVFSERAGKEGAGWVRNGW